MDATDVFRLNVFDRKEAAQMTELANAIDAMDGEAFLLIVALATWVLSLLDGR